MKLIRLALFSAIAIFLGIFLGTVPLRDGMTAADLLESWLTRDREDAQKPRRISKNTTKSEEKAMADAGHPPSPKRHQANTSDAKKMATTDKSPSTPVPQAPITAEAANSPEQTSASDKAAMDKLISRKAGK